MEWYKDRFEKIKNGKENDRRELIFQLVEDLKSIDVESIHAEAKEILECDNWKEYLKDKVVKSVTALANTEGGLVFWGFKDKIWQPQPIKNIRDFYQKLNDFCGCCALPSIPGIESIMACEKDGSGLALTYVPMSDVGPHQADIGKKETKGRYWVRRSNKCEYLKHYELEDRFGRRPHPFLAPEFAIIQKKYGDKDGYEIKIDLWNHGRGLARWSSIEVRAFTDQDWRSPKGNAEEEERGIKVRYGTHVEKSEKRCYYQSAPINEFHSLVYPGNHRPHIDLFIKDSQVDKWEDDVRICWRVFADGMRPSEDEFKIKKCHFKKVKGHILLNSFREYHRDWNNRSLTDPYPLPDNVSIKEFEERHGSIRFPGSSDT